MGNKSVSTRTLPVCGKELAGNAAGIWFLSVSKRTPSPGSSPIHCVLLEALCADADSTSRDEVNQSEFFSCLFKPNIHSLTSFSACLTSSSVINSPSMPFPSFLARARAMDPAQRTRPAMSAPENPPVAESAARS